MRISDWSLDVCSSDLAISGSYDAADVVLVNTCGFLDSAKQESLEAIGEAMRENGRVIVTGCMGVESEKIRGMFPDVLAVTGPQQYEAVGIGRASCRERVCQYV